MINPTQSKKSRDPLIDALKGFAILLVLLGHAVQFHTNNFDNNLLFRVIYSFHMPLFMFLSGWVAYVTHVRQLPKRFNRLLIPFIAWCLIDYFVLGTHRSVNFVEYIIQCVKFPDDGLWFLWVLFLCYCLLAIATYFKKVMGQFGKYSVFVVYVLLQLIPVHDFGLQLLKWNSLYFLIGNFVANNKERLSLRFKKPVYVSSVIVFPILVPFWSRVHGVTFYQLLVEHHIHGVSLIGLAYKIITAGAGVALTFFVFGYLSKVSALKFFSWFGLYTLDLYALEYWFLKFELGTGTIAIISIFLVTVILSLMVAFIFRQFPFIATVLFGSDSKMLIPKFNLVNSHDTELKEVE